MSNASSQNCKGLQGAPDAQKRTASYTPVCEQAADTADGVLCNPLPSLVDCGCLEADRDNGILVHIHVQPRAAKNAFAGIHAGAVKLRITAPPVDGKANAMIAEILAKMFHVSKSAVTLVSGQQSRRKRFRVAGISYDAALKILETLLS